MASSSSPALPDLPGLLPAQQPHGAFRVEVRPSQAAVDPAAAPVPSTLYWCHFFPCGVLWGLVFPNSSHVLGHLEDTFTCRSPDNCTAAFLQVPGEEVAFPKHLYEVDPI